LAPSDASAAEGGWKAAAARRSRAAAAGPTPTAYTPAMIKKRHRGRTKGMKVPSRIKKIQRKRRVWRPSA
jgi:hypothetical protein